MPPRAVVFDLGGVVFDSPLHFLADYEELKGLEPAFIAKMVGGYGSTDGPWQQLERGEIELAEFCEAFDGLLRTHGVELSTADMMRDMGTRAQLRPQMVRAIRRLRAANLRVGALTNNWVTDEDYDARMQPLREEFDLFIESCKVGMRKPEPRIYELTVDRIGVSATETIFLDDIGGNLKVARSLGMTTIKVSEPGAALQELGRLVGLELG